MTRSQPRLTIDLAGTLPRSMRLMAVGARIQRLSDRYLSPEILQDRLDDLPQQFRQPCPRSWPLIPWKRIATDQVVGISLATFCRILRGTINTEAPIRGYTQASRQYLSDQYPAMARFVGGVVDCNGALSQLGLWEREEKRHTPALIKIHGQLTSDPLDLNPHSARPYTPYGDPRSDLYRHGLHRIATEYGATCLYLWLMAHSTGPLQQALEPLLIDEINHMVKFWGFGRWAYPEVGVLTGVGVFAQAMVQKLRQPALQGSLFHTLHRMMAELGWNEWSMANRLTLIYSFDQVMRALWLWNQSLTCEHLETLFGRAKQETS